MAKSPQEIPESQVHVDTETFTCPNCGGVMKFDINSQKFACAACKTEQDLETLSESVREHDFKDYLAREAASIPFEGMAAVTCQNCGLEMTLDDKQVAAVCPMCGSTQIAQAKQHAGIPPEGVVPFKFDRQDAQNRFRAWAKKRWFAPNDFKKLYGEGALSGMYLPFWTYDASVVSRYRGEGGRRRTVKDKDGKTRTVTDWFPVSGWVTSEFDDVQVCASEKEKRINNILPYNTIENTKPYAPGYLSGYYAELYTIRADKAFDTAKDIMDRTMHSLADKDIRRRYDDSRNIKLKSTFSNVTYKHLLLPVWSSAFGYKGKTYNYLINGETGKVSGQRPYSAIKIAIAALIAVAAIVLGVILFSGNDTAGAASAQSTYGRDNSWHGSVKAEIQSSGRSSGMIYCFSNGRGMS